jgi:hypothetical protein
VPSGRHAPPSGPRAGACTRCGRRRRERRRRPGAHRRSDPSPRTAADRGVRSPCPRGPARRGIAAGTRARATPTPRRRRAGRPTDTCVARRPNRCSGRGPPRRAATPSIRRRGERSRRNRRSAVRAASIEPIGGSAVHVGRIVDVDQGSMLRVERGPRRFIHHDGRDRREEVPEAPVTGP